MVTFLLVSRRGGRRAYVGAGASRAGGVTTVLIESRITHV